MPPATLSSRTYSVDTLGHALHRDGELRAPSAKDQPFANLPLSSAAMLDTVFFPLLDTTSIQSTALEHSIEIDNHRRWADAGMPFHPMDEPQLRPRPLYGGPEWRFATGVLAAA